MLLTVAIAAAALQAPIASDSVALGPGSRARFADAAEASSVLAKRDAFVAAMSPFDRSARLQVGREVPESEYLAFVSKETRDWSAADRDLLRPILDDFREKTAAWKVDLPAEVLFLKTTGREEGRAAYCRGAAVVLPENVLVSTGDKLPDTVFHELFHVFSTHHPDLRRALYAVVGFEVCPEVALPPAMARRKLTNPDAPRMDALVPLPTAGAAGAATPIILGRSDLYDEKVGGAFFQQMDFRLLVLDRSGAAPRPALQPDGTPRLITPGDDYLARIGRNTDYIIHPEEILADNFVLLVNHRQVPSPEILDKLDAVLRRR